MKIYTASLVAIALSQIVSCTSQKTINTETPKTYAEISVKEGGNWNDRKYEGGTFKNVQEHTLDPRHTDHSFDIRYEGPGWESNKVGYRLYLDWRNAIDIFGKKTDKMILPQVGQDGFDSYHLMQDWGSDILKVGKGQGLGSIVRYANNEMHHFRTVEQTTAKVKNTNNHSTVEVFYKGWQTLNDKIDVKSVLTIYPDERYTRYTFTPSAAIPGISTGIVKIKPVELLKKTSASQRWAYIATFGDQSMFNDKLGMAVFYETSAVSSLADGPHDHLIVFKPTVKPVTYYFLATWEQEMNGIKTQEEFVNYINEKLEQLNTNNKLD